MIRRTPEETWDALGDQALDDEMDRVLAMTRVERQRELRVAGFDLEAEAARADALRARASIPSSHIRKVTRFRTTRIATLLAAALVVIGVLAAIVRDRDRNVAAPHRPDPGGTSRDSDLVSRATDLRRAATTACRDKRWKDCLDLLDQARDLDPEGDDVPAMKALRQTAGAAPSPP